MTTTEQTDPQTLAGRLPILSECETDAWSIPHPVTGERAVYLRTDLRGRGWLMPDGTVSETQFVCPRDWLGVAGQVELADFEARVASGEFLPVLS